MADLNGSWLGTYWQWGNPTRFEATLVQGGHHLTGSILDEGPLGEARLTGEVTGRSVRFVKTYSGAGQWPVTYSGEVSETGDYMSGTWFFEGGFDRGNWEAHRQEDDLLAELKRVQAKQVLQPV
ncbi:MAG: hypothetical protein ACO4AI_00390 [Prochlorothrix sp.]|nr:hypothetical protein [Prochlorothrix sp.]